MDNDWIKQSLAGFDTVWQRVAGDHGPPHEEVYSEENVLRKLIHSEICAARQASSLARMFQGDGRAILLRHAADAKRHIRRLRAEYFIHTGICPDRDSDCQEPCGKLASLRAALFQTNERADMYTQAAKQTESAELRQMYETFACDAMRHAREIRALLIESF